MVYDIAIPTLHQIVVFRQPIHIYIYRYTDDMCMYIYIYTYSCLFFGNQIPDAISFGHLTALDMKNTEM